ncbi:hypothetical protein GCM10027346_33930 [Hymenobacter seoulensis]
MKKFLTLVTCAALFSWHTTQAQTVDSTQIRLQMQQQRADEAKAALGNKKQETAATRNNVDQSKGQLRDQQNAMREQKRQLKEQKIELKRQQAVAKEARRQESAAHELARAEKRKAKEARKASKM